MIIKQDKNEERKRRHARVRQKLSGTHEIPRLNVYRSLNHVYVQFIDDELGVTLAAVSSNEKAMTAAVKDKTKSEAAYIVGQEAAKRAKAKKITKVVFDRSGYIYTGRVKSLAEGARAGGLEF
ncbi:MAG: 50S ribosomal protein L18 [Firmicutes bacterium]|nr:50S ribosomal protein L18 [Bacillota bacterium]